jgi:tryptophanase
MKDIARELAARLIAEPYRTKVIERLRLPERQERIEVLRKAFFSPVQIDSADVFIDLLTDSGTGAMSDEQWAALMRGDEAYIRSRNFFELEEAVHEVMGFKYVIPTHQGRAAEHIVLELMAQPGQKVLSNTHFDTTRAHVEHRGAAPIDLIGDWLWSFGEPLPFKGNFDLAKLEVALERYHEQVPMIIITVLNNFACSSPVSMQNIREVKRLADRYSIPIFFDACRFAENAYFIKQREPGYQDRSIREIALEMLSYGQGCWMSAKKDAIVNIGGFIGTNDESFARRCQEKAVLYEGFFTYGGLARRDLSAMAAGLREGTELEYLRHRIDSVRYLGDQIQASGAIVSQPIGGSGVFVDVRSIYSHLPSSSLPGVAFFSDLYREGAVRAAGAAFPMQTVDVTTGDIEQVVFELARLAVPRRVYSKGHFDYVAAVVSHVVRNAPASPGYRQVGGSEVLGHFFVKFEPISG